MGKWSGHSHNEPSLEVGMETWTASKFRGTKHMKDTWQVVYHSVYPLGSNDNPMFACGSVTNLDACFVFV